MAGSGLVVPDLGSGIHFIFVYLLYFDLNQNKTAQLEIGQIPRNPGIEKGGWRLLSPVRQFDSFPQLHTIMNILGDTELPDYECTGQPYTISKLDVGRYILK